MHPLLFLPVDWAVSGGFAVFVSLLGTGPKGQTERHCQKKGNKKYGIV